MIVENKGEIEARSVLVGDKMSVHNEGVVVDATVVAIEQLSQKAPVRLVLTKSGSIVVNSVVASTTETSGSKIVESLLHVASSIAGESGVRVVRDVSYAVGSWITNGDALSAVSEPSVSVSA